MPRRAAPLPSTLGDVFSVATALSLNVPAGRLRRRDLHSPFRGVRQIETMRGRAYDPGAEYGETRDRVLALMRAYAFVMPPHAFFAGATAAVAWGAPVPHPCDTLCVGVHAPARALTARGVRGVKIAPTLAPLRRLAELRLTSPATSWAMLAGKAARRTLIAVGDAFVRVPRDSRGRPMPGEQLATVSQLEAAARAPYRRRRLELLDALAEVRVGSASPLETDMRLDLTACGLPEPELDAEIRDRTGRLLGIGDLAYRAQRVVIEVEGDHHRTDRRQWQRDIQKQRAYVAEGWDLVRVTSADVRGRNRSAVAAVRAALARHT